MKKIVVAAFAALVAFGAFAKADDAAVANRKWVRKAIAEALGKKTLDADVVTNANGTVTITSPFTSTNIPGAVSISMTILANTNEALRVDNSTIPGMTNRTYYAYDYAQCGYMNTNAPVRAIYASKVVNMSVVTNYYTGEFSNHYRVVTNRVTETRFSATGTNGTAFVSFKTNGVYWIQAATNAAWKAQITRTKVSDAKRSQLIGTPLAKTGRRFSLFDLLVPTAYADAPSGNGVADDGTLTWRFSLSSIQVHLQDGTKVNFDISDLTFEYSNTLPEKPDPTHTCVYDGTCKCVDYGKSQNDIANNPAYEASVATDTISGSIDFSSWMTEEEWKAAGGKVNKKGKWYLDSDDGKYSIVPSDITGTDAWGAQMKAMTSAIADYLSDCQENYKKAHICDSTKSMPDHDWYTETCGNNTWKTCRRNPSHKEGTAQHQYNATGTSNGASGHTIQCQCGKKPKTEGHSISGGGTKNYIRNPQGKITGWTIAAGQCSKCPYAIPAVVHVCEHHYCHTCEGGDGCSLPCQYCGGGHNFTQSARGCKKCTCPGCGCSEILTNTGGSPAQTVSGHGGWHACTDSSHKDEENERSENGQHCLCSCGYNHCKDESGFWSSQYHKWFGRTAESLHHRTQNNPPTYEQITGDDEQHWACELSACTRCGDKYGKKEDHSWGAEDTPHYKKLSNELCALRKECENCQYKKYQDADEAGSHTPQGSATTYTCTSSTDPICKAYYVCANCLETYYEEEDHVKDATPQGKCKCANCKIYQFAHTYDQTDACGNKACACGEIDPGVTPEHKNYVDAGGGKHHCACGKDVKNHIFGAWALISSTETTDHYKRTCTVANCTAYEEKDVPKGTDPAECTENQHIPLYNACGCLCGMYTPGATCTLSNHVGEVGKAHEDEHFHHWSKDNNNVEKCSCDCDAKHRFKEWSTYTKNLRSNGGAFCPVCSYCKTKDRNGSIVAEGSHIPKDKVLDGTKCGCKCGLLNTTATLAKFHPKHPNTCCCYGINGDGQGSWHHPLKRNDCENICQHKFNGVSHIANKGYEAVKEPIANATWENHTCNANTCGCKCGEFTGVALTANMTKLHVDKNHSTGCGCVCGKRSTPHNNKSNGQCGCNCGSQRYPHVYPSGQCGCVCGDYSTPHHFASGECRCYCRGQHNKVAGENGVCPDVCHGPCGESTQTIYKYLSLHEPNPLTCGCKCGSAGGASVFTPVDMYAEFHSHPNPSRTCWCYNMCKHRFPKPDPDCTGVCTNFNCMGRVDTGADRDSPSIHTFVTNNVGYCGCECGRKVDQKHRHSETNCYCYAKNAKSVSHPRKDMNHQWVLTNRQLIGEESECDICGTVSAKYELTYTCKRCGITKTVETFEGCNCHASEQGECDCTTCTCQFCKAGTGYCTTCWKQCQPNCKTRTSKSGGGNDDDDGNDGNTPGSDDPRNIK